FERRHKCAWTALLLVALGSEMVERYANGQLVTKAILDVEKLSLAALHRPHRIGKRQNAESARETIPDHAEELRIHERLAAGEPDLFRAPAVALDLVEIRGDFVAREIEEPIVPRARFYVAVLAGDVAERSGVEPKRLQAPRRDTRAPCTRRRAFW